MLGQVVQDLMARRTFAGIGPPAQGVAVSGQNRAGQLRTGRDMAAAAAPAPAPAQMRGARGRATRRAESGGTSRAGHGGRSFPDAS